MQDDVVAERYQAPGSQLSESIGRAGDKDTGHAAASPRRALAGPLQDHDRNLPRGLALVFSEPGRDGDAVGKHALPFLALRLARPHLERLRASRRPHLHPRHGIRLEVVVPAGVVRRSALRCDDNVPLPVAVVHHRRGALVSAARPHRGEQYELVPEGSDSLPSLGMELLDGRVVPVRHRYLLTFVPEPLKIIENCAFILEKLRERRKCVARLRPVTTLTVECTIGTPNSLASFVVETMFLRSRSLSIDRTDFI